MSSSPAAVTEKKTFEVRFGEFESLPTRKGVDFVDSPKFGFLGHEWLLRVYPGGNDFSDSGYISAFLIYKSDRNIEVEVSLSLQKTGTRIETQLAYGREMSHRTIWGTSNFALRPIILNVLQKGALAIDVQMRQLDPACSPFVPENPLCKSILDKFMDEESADVVFEIRSGDVRFHAHRFVLQHCSSVLAELCKSEGDLTPIPIAGVKPEIFRHVLYYAYGGNEDEDDLKANAMEIIDAADRFGVVTLKLKAEACYVKTTHINVGNMMENLIYADTKNCALLKEAVVDFIVENGNEVEDKVSLEDAPSGVITDLLNAMNRWKEKDVGGGRGTKRRGDELSMMRVDDLRKKLCEKGLDVDGSRKAMIATLKENSRGMNISCRPSQELFC